MFIIPRNFWTSMISKKILTNTAIVLVAGTVIFGTLGFSPDAFADPARQTICHKPGTPAEQTIEVEEVSVLQAHLNHGDFVGECGTSPLPIKQHCTQNDPLHIGPVDGTFCLVTACDEGFGDGEVRFIDIDRDNEHDEGTEPLVCRPNI